LTNTENKRLMHNSHCIWQSSSKCDLRALDR